MKKIIAVVAFLLLVCANDYAGTRYYLNDNSLTNGLYTTAVGNDANSGKTPALPMATLGGLLTKYAANFAAGDTIFIDAGTYQEKNLLSPKGGVVITGAGITLTKINESGSDRHFMVINTNNTVLANMEINGFDDNGDNGYDVQTLMIATNVTGVQINNVQVNGSKASSPSGGMPIEVESGAQVVFNGGGATCNAYDQTEAGGGIHVAGATTNVLIDNYQFIGNGHNVSTGGNGDALSVDGGTVVVRNTRFEYNKLDGDLMGAAIGQTGGTLSVFDSYISSNTTNLLDTDEPGGAIYIAGGSFTLKRSVVANHQNPGGSSSYGGGIAFVGGTGEIDSCYFYSNQAADAYDLYVDGGTVNAVNCWFTSGSTPIGTGGAGVLNLYNSGSPAAYSGSGGGTLNFKNTTAHSYVAKPSHLPAYLPISCFTIPCVHPVIAVNNITQTLCSYSANGGATASASGGTAPYTYSWSPTLGDTNATTNSLKAQTYTVSVSDATGCGSTTAVTITAGSNLTASIAGGNITNVACFGQSTGSLAVTATGGAGTNTYSWSPTGGTGQTGSGLTQGSYTVTVTDGNACVATASASITQPATALAIPTPQITNSTCGKPDGVIALSPTGGTPAYKYSWSNGITGQTGSNLAMGSYTITVTDNNGCTQTTTDSIKKSFSSLTLAATATKIASCGISNGSAYATPAGGQSPYAYVWTGGATGQTTSNLAGGSYYVTVTDNLGCTYTAETTVSATPAAAISILSQKTVNVLCNGASTGKLFAQATAGTPNFTYAWSVVGATADSIAALKAGSYTVTVTDGNACTATASASITQTPTAISINSTPTPSTCGMSNGSVAVAASGGTPNYKYSWSYNNTADSVLQGLNGGTYTVTVTDANQCAQTFAVTSTQIPGLLLGVGKHVDVACYGTPTGKLAVTVAGGTPQYTYAWVGANSTSDSLTGVGPGTYKVYVADSKGCKDSLSQTIVNLAAAPLSIDTTTTGKVIPSTCGKTNGSILANAQGGTPNYTYTWSGAGVTANDSLATNLGSGLYQLTVTDGRGCALTASFSNQPTSDLSISFLAGGVTMPKCYNDATGQATATISNGTQPFTYSWVGASSNTNAIVNVPAGTYTLQVTDGLGCANQQAVTISQPPAVTVSLAQQSIATCDSANGTLVATANGGVSGFQYTWAGSSAISNTLTNLKAGVYTVTATDANGCSATAVGQLDNSAAAKLSVSQAPATICVGQSASFTIAATGGTRPFVYSWSNLAPGYNNDTVQTVNPRVTTTYTVQVKDSAGCLSAPQTIQVIVRPPLQVNFAANSLQECQGQQAKVTAHAKGGDSTAYSFSWTPAVGVDSVLNIPTANATTQTYTVTLTDNNCSTAATSTVSVQVKKSPIASIVTQPLAICGSGSVVLKSYPPATDSVNQTWNFGDQTSTSSYGTHTYQNPGSYPVTLTVDSNGCSSSYTASGLVTILAKPTANFTYTPNEPLQVDTLISFTSNSTVADSLFWKFGDKTALTSLTQSPLTHAYADTGTYIVMLKVKNIDGCVDSTAEVLHIIPQCSWPQAIPNVFSPNGDKVNDYFVISGSAFSSLKCTIFNRWGSEVFQYNAKNDSWDGHTFNGGVAPEGTYFYLFEGTCVVGEKQSSRQGFITIVR